MTTTKSYKMKFQIPALFWRWHLGSYLAFKLCRVSVFKFLFPKHSAIARWVMESDFGRRYGWIMELEGKAVAETDYIGWDDYSQFWWHYKIRWLNKEYEGLECRPNELIQLKPSLRSRRFPDVLSDRFLAVSNTPGLLGVRSLSVPTARFFADEVGPN